MIAGPFHILAPAPASIQVELEPAYNALNSLALISAVDQYPDIDAGAARVAARLSAEERRRHRLVFSGLGAALALEGEWPDFPSYLQDLAAHDAVDLRDRALRRLCDQLAGYGYAGSGAAPPEPEALLADTQALASFLARLFPDTTLDPALRSELHELLCDPPALRALLTAHLREMWDRVLAAEWARVLPRLRDQVAVLRQRLVPDASASDAFRAFTGRDLPGDAQIGAAGRQRIVFVPSPHMGRYVTRLDTEPTARLFFSPPRHLEALTRTSPVRRAELLARLTALADETRLRILALLTRHDGLSAQEIMARLELSQSSASRHLNALRNAGYVLERRGAGASKHYSVNPIGIDTTVRALTQALAEDEVPAAAQQDRAAYPREVQRFLDEEGRVTGWPAKEKDKLLVLEHLAARFEPGRPYTEGEVNALLRRHMTPSFTDHVNLRRALYDYRFLGRERDGSRYWRTDAPAPEAAGVG